MKKQQKRLAGIFDAYSKSYTETVNDAISFTGLSVDFFTRVKGDYILDLAETYFGGASTLKVLDVGCGVGNLHTLLSPQLAELKGVDVSSESIATAREHNPAVEYSVYDGKRLPYDDDCFDIAYTICVMHHVPPPQRRAFVREMHRVVRPGGIVLVFEHNPRNHLTRRAVNRCPFDKDAVLLRSEETVRLLKDAGLIHVSSRFILSVPAANSFLRRIDHIFSRFPLGAQYYVSAEKA